jgi:hypothetical protein
MSQNNSSQANKGTDPLSNRLDQEDKLRDLQPTPPNTIGPGNLKFAPPDEPASQSPPPASFEERLEGFERDILKELDAIVPSNSPRRPRSQQTEPDSLKRPSNIPSVAETAGALRHS